jgi:hypothetical protein
MKPALLILCALFTAGVALGDPYVIAKGQAKRDVNQSNARQGIAPAQPNQPAPPPAAPIDPVLAATLQNIASLRADFAALNVATGAKVDATQKVSLLNNLSAAAQGSKPASASVQKLAGHLTTATLGRKTLPAQQAKLARDIHAIFNSSHLAAAQQQAVFDDVKKVLEGGGAATEDAANVIADLQQIAGETR